MRKCCGNSFNFCSTQHQQQFLMLLLTEVGPPTQYRENTTLLITYFHIQYLVLRMCYIATRSNYPFTAGHEIDMLSFNLSFKSNQNKILLQINRGQTEPGILADHKGLDQTL